MNASISVIVPVYNAEKTIRRCVESLLCGEERDLQVILAEDCSKDDSWSVCQELSREYPQIQCIRNETNRGVSHTRNRALELAKGEYILFVDSDDWVSRKYAMRLLAGERANFDDTLVICGYYYISHEHGTKQAITWDKRDTCSTVENRDFYLVTEKTMLQQLWNKIFRRDIIEKHHIRFDEAMSMGEDFKFVLDYMEAAEIQRCVVLNEPLYYYIRWGNSSLMSKFGLIQNQQEYERIEQLHRLSGLQTTEKRDAMLMQSRRNYVYHISRNPNLTKEEKLHAIERIMQDGKAGEYYRDQQILQVKEKTVALLTDAKNIPSRLHGRLGREKLQRLIRHQREMLTASEFSIISQNCIGGVLYHDMGMQFLSPTINTFIKEPDFVKLCSDLRHYMSLPLQMRWEEEYPVGRLDDVEIYFMHYATCKEAKEAWERRKQRINYDKILVVATDRNGFDYSVFELWKVLPYPKVLLTVNKKYANEKGTVVFFQYAQQPFVPDLIPGRDFYADNRLLNAVNEIGGQR